MQLLERKIIVSKPYRSEWSITKGPDKWTSQKIKAIIETCQLEGLYKQDTPLREDIKSAIESSRSSILGLRDNWDDEGSPGYTKETWRRATLFLENCVKWLWCDHETVLAAPNILPGPNGSIDLHWDTQKYEVLINIPADRTVKLGFYGDNKGDDFRKGSLNPKTKNEDFLLWLKNLV